MVNNLTKNRPHIITCKCFKERGVGKDETAILKRIKRAMRDNKLKKQMIKNLMNIFGLEET